MTSEDEDGIVTSEDESGIVTSEDEDSIVTSEDEDGIVTSGVGETAVNKSMASALAVKPLGTKSSLQSYQRSHCDALFLAKLQRSANFLKAF